MSKSIDELLSEGLEYLSLLELEKNKLTGISNRIRLRQLCSTTHATFHPFFNELKRDLVKQRDSLASFSGFQVALEVVVELCCELKNFIVYCRI
jgi:hypothetical protein